MGKNKRNSSTTVKNCEIVINFLDLVEEHRYLSPLELRLDYHVKNVKTEALWMELPSPNL